MRRGNADDAALLFEWANDPQTRANSFQQSAISWDDHLHWYRSLQERHSDRLYILETVARHVPEMVTHVPCGQIRFELREGGYRVSLAVAPNIRGKGLGTELLQRGIAELQRELGPQPLFIAYVKDANIPSSRLFQSAAFDVDLTGPIVPGQTRYTLEPAALPLRPFVLGTVQFGVPYGVRSAEGCLDEAVVDEILLAAFNRGIRRLDTSAAYGTALERIGGFHRRHGKRFAVSSKFLYHEVRDGDVRSEILRQCDRLQLSRLDTLYFHRPHEMLEHPEIVDQLQRCREEGLVQRIGVSIYTNSEFDRALEAGIDAVQMPLNLLDNASRKGRLLESASAKGVELHARSIFLQGILLLERAKLPSRLRQLEPALDHINRLAHSASRGSKQDAVLNLALGYVLSMPGVKRVLVGVDSVAQMQKLCDAVRDPLDPSVIQDIESISVSDERLLDPRRWSELPEE